MEGVERTPDDDDGDIYGDDDVWNLKMLPDIGVLALLLEFCGTSRCHLLCFVILEF